MGTLTAGSTANGSLRLSLPGPEGTGHSPPGCRSDIVLLAKAACHLFYTGERCSLSPLSAREEGLVRGASQRLRDHTANHVANTIT